MPLFSEHDQPVSLDITLFRRQLQEHYLQSLCKIPRFPGDTESCLDMDEIYTNLSIHYDMAKPCAPIKIPLKSHHEIFTRTVNGVLPRRILVLGRGGSGKSTLLAKIAYDWAMEDEKSPLKDIPLLFLLNMRHMQYDSDLEDAIFRQLLPKDTVITKNSLRNFLEKNPDSAMILLDSYDEFSRGDVLSSNVLQEGNVVNIVSNNCLTSCRVLVSSRHWRASDFAQLGNIYAKIDVEGFSEKDVNEYIMRYFADLPNVGERLYDYIRNNNLFHVASVPLMTLMFCLYWKDSGEEAIPDKLNDLYTEILRILYRHCLAKETSHISLPLEEVVLQLGQCACVGLWPPENRLVFAYEELQKVTSIQCIEDGCKTGIISIEKHVPAYKTGTKDMIGTEKSIVFCHKSVQEKSAGEYLSYLASTEPDELTRKLKQLDSVQTCLSVQMILRFACGSSLKAAEYILERLVEIASIELEGDIQAYYDNTLKDIDKSKTVQEFIEMCLLCNYECGSNQFSQLLANLFPTGKMQFIGLSPYASAAIAFFLSCINDRDVITKLRIIQIPKPGITPSFYSTTAAVSTLEDAVIDNLNSISSRDELRNIYTDYIERHQSTNDLDSFTSNIGSNYSYGLVYIGLWEYFKTWHSSNCVMDIGPIIDAVKFTALNTLDLSYVILLDAGQRLVGAIEQGHLTCLTHLIVPSTGMNADNMTQLVMLLPHCVPKLHYLDISGNNASNSQVIHNLAKSLPMLSVQVFNIRGMYAPSSDITTLAQVIPQCCTHLIELRMTANYMDDETGKALVSTLPCAHQLQVLWIDVNGMSRRIHKKLVMTMGKLTQLRVLGMYNSPYENDLVLYTAAVVTSLNLTYLTLGASYSDDHSDQSPLKRLITRIMKTTDTTDESVPVLSRSSWRSFMSSLQHKAAQMRRLGLHDIRLHEADLQDLLTLCREHDIGLG